MRYSSLAAVLLLSVGCYHDARRSTEQPIAEVDVQDLFTHETLGELYPEDVDWQTDEASVPFADTAIEVCLADGTEDGPSDAALSGYEWIEANWRQVLVLIQEQAFDYYQPYADAVEGVPKFDSPEQLWGTEVLLAVRVFSKDDFTVTMRFKWQEDADPHQVTFYVEELRCRTHSVDG